MAKATLYPTKIEQPNKNKSSGLAGVHFQEVRRDGKVHLKNLRDLNDPKYHHQWSNTSNLKEGKTAQCGHKSSYHCSHKTYYSIKGYRNTCPIAGVTGTYTQPATLSLYFSPEKKKIYSDAKINSVTLSFKHRCVGVDVATDKIYTNWGPNFSGFSKYPGRKVLTVKFGGETLTYNTNPPLSREKYSTVSFKFKDVSYKDLHNKSIDIIYGNNLSTNPGNIYIKDLSIEVDYEDGKPYLEGKADKKTLYVSDEDSCKSKIHFTLEAGYKQGQTKMSEAKAPKNLQKSVIVEKRPANCEIEMVANSKNKKIVDAYLTDNSNITGEKEVSFKLKENNQVVSFKYKAVKRNKPKITIPTKIEKNVKLSIPSIVAKNGCTTKITVYDEGINGSKCILSGNDLDINNQDNIVKKEGRDEFEEWLSGLSCGKHTLFIKFGDSSNNDLLEYPLKVIPTQYKFEFSYTDNGAKIPITSLKKDQDKENNSFPITIELKNHEKYVVPPKFKIVNPTYKILNEMIGESTWDTNPESQENNVLKGYSINTEIGLYKFGDYNLLIKDTSNCPNDDTVLPILIKSSHKQRFDTLFVRGEDSTAFDYTYLTALEGDTIKEPIYPVSITAGASFEDIKICSSHFIQAGLSETNFLELNISNRKEEAITNLLLELNVLGTDSEGNYTVTTDEWVEEDGIFKNLQEQFAAYNSNIVDRVTLKNLSLDDDLIDEEDVYISISKLEAESTLKIRIPFRSHVEKDVDLQILLFGEPMKIYSINDCSDETQTFEKINFRVYDSIATSMVIEGDTDIQEPSETDCDIVCYKTENGVKYKITNIDTKSTDSRIATIIKNDPRLVAYKILDKEGNEILEGNEYVENNTNLEEPKESYIKLKESKISATIKFEGYEVENLTGYTNSNGIVTFYIKIPNSINRKFNSEELAGLLDNISAEKTQITSQVINTPFSYKPGQTVPLQLEILYKTLSYPSEIIFYPKIGTAGTSDEITVFYRVCGLPNNEAILKTIFKTATEDEVPGANQYEVIPNEVSKDLLFGVKTSLNLYTRLEKIIVENKTVNRLHLKLVNKKRFNKDINITFRENKEDINKTGRYKYINSQIENGTITKVDDTILWSIPYLEANTSVIGFIDFEAEEVGINEIDISAKDFLNEG
ncbi:MAG: hypothetical protein J6B87_07415 [Clostridia bacterium]|nr:hypothetical protein [Clostridia bacterium]